MRARFAAEGVSFLTKGLRSYVKAIDIALSTGHQLNIPGFSKLRNTSLPLFLGWLTRLVFDTCGYELVHPDPAALKHLRELCYLFSKLELPYEERTKKKVLDSFVNVENQLPENQVIVDFRDDSVHLASGRLLSDEWLHIARTLVRRIVTPLDPNAIKPRHGPGAVATGERVCEKSNFSRIYAHLEPIYPFTEWMMWNLNHVVDSIPAENPKISLEHQATAKVVLVPKDSRGPRLISCEPLEVQWIQQGLKSLLVERLESYRLTAGRINFADQTVNRRLALLSSKTGESVTLDMKDASDRVSLELVKYLFQDNSRLLAALLAARSQFTRLPCGTVIALKKFAPMGSATCFPVLSIVFWALSVAALIQNGVPRRKALASVYVYGDDLIVGKQDYTTLLTTLPKVGLMFNLEKCCTARSFRESCGCDAYFGVDVTPVKLKTVWSPSLKNPKCLESYVAFSNAMYGRGHFRTAELVRLAVEEVYGAIPYTNRFTVHESGSYVTETAGVAWATRTSHANEYNLLNRRLKCRVNSALHTYEVQSWSTFSLKRVTRIDGYAEMLRRYSGDYGAHGGVYAMTRRNRLNRVWLQNL